MRNSKQTRKLDRKRPIFLDIPESSIWGERVVLKTLDHLSVPFAISFREDLDRVIERPISSNFEYDRSIFYDKNRLYKFYTVEISEHQNSGLLICWYFKEWMEQ